MEYNVFPKKYITRFLLASQTWLDMVGQLLSGWPINIIPISKILYGSTTIHRTTYSNLFLNELQNSRRKNNNYLRSAHNIHNKKFIYLLHSLKKTWLVSKVIIIQHINDSSCILPCPGYVRLRKRKPASCKIPISNCLDDAYGRN